MLPKEYRLSKKKDFDLVFKKGESIKNGFLIFKMLKSSSATEGGITQSRFGFVVSKKVSMKANVRNKVKRRVRDAVSAKLKELKRPTDVIVITLPGIEKKEFSEIEKTVADSFKKLKLI